MRSTITAALCFGSFITRRVRSATFCFLFRIFSKLPRVVSLQILFLTRLLRTQHFLFSTTIKTRCQTVSRHHSTVSLFHRNTHQQSASWQHSFQTVSVMKPRTLVIVFACLVASTVLFEPAEAGKKKKLLAALLLGAALKGGGKIIPLPLPLPVSKPLSYVTGLSSV